MAVTAMTGHESRFSAPAYAPGMLEFVVHAAPGSAEVETAMIYVGKPERRVVAKVDLTRDGPARVTVR